MEGQDWLKVLFGAVLAVSSSVLTQLFIAKQSDLSQRIDEVIKVIWEYAEISSKYWCDEYEGKPIELAESKISGLDFYVGSLISSISSEHSRTVAWMEIEKALESLADSTTGGSFQVKGRPANKERATEIYSNASQLCVLLRSERRRLIRLPVRAFLKCEC